MTKTSFKLEEARYFFGQMKINKNTDKLFIFNLSAFLSAARSITFIMQNEFAHRGDFDSWYERKQVEICQDQDFRLFNDLRVTTIHHETVIPNKHVDIYILEPVKITATATAANISINTSSNAISIISQRPQGYVQLAKEQKPKISYSWFFKEKPGEDVVKLCSEYITKLEGLVVECEKLFSV